MDSNTRLETASFATFSEALLKSGLVAEEALNSLLVSARSNSQSLTKLLIAQDLLTRFQVNLLSEGRGSELRIGNYDVLDRLGAGGMGTVFKARHRRMKRLVALKVLAGNLSQNPIFVKRFQREVETIASLGHPNVVMAYDADESDVGHFLVMELVNGRDLATCVADQGVFPVSLAVHCILQTARGLAYAHAQAIIHRDIKPHNLLLDAQGVVKVTDLGLARLNHGATGPASGFDVTMAGGVIGTADYMPPEQAVDSTTIDHRADIYSLGCTLYFLLVGRPPFSGPTMMSVLLKHRDGVIPSLSAERTEVPAELDGLFERMLAKEPDERMQSMSEVVSELETIARNLPEDDIDLGQGLEITFGDSGSEASTVHTRISEQTIESGTPSTSQASVLIVEPSRVQASIIKGYLHEQSHTVLGAATKGNDAIELVRKLRPKAVISALHLSDLDGLQLAEQIRAEFKGESPGFVLITSEGSEADSAALIALHRVQLLHKPFTPEQLSDAVKQVTGASMILTPTQAAGRMPGKPNRAALRVLIVDDSATARVQVRTVLQGLGFTQFQEVPDGAYAIAVAAREICDLIVTDYNMPLMDGRALVSYLKQNPPTAAIPIIMVTTETEPRVLDPVRKLGVVAIVEKAFPPTVVGPLLDSIF
ncbi:protein kinase domain-containing protein [Anatilimnocola floriformis]|uniref:protein kinase domain-containing protein n=1 Tax=Anatilimnocola floriformis TaxID=2948575 RepID=UPI0020C4EC12|nr:response regulator [Anatilimnocola floriformis]